MNNSTVNTHINKYYTSSCMEVSVAACGLSCPPQWELGVPWLSNSLTGFLSHTSQPLAASPHAADSHSHTRWCPPQASGGGWRRFHHGHPNGQHVLVCPKWCPTLLGSPVEHLQLRITVPYTQWVMQYNTHTHTLVLIFSMLLLDLLTYKPKAHTSHLTHICTVTICWSLST